MADRAFRNIVLLAVAVLLPLGPALAITLFPGAVQTALHGSDAFVQTCLAALYGLGQQLPPIGVAVIALFLAAMVAGAARAAALVSRTRALTGSCIAVPIPERLSATAQGLGLGHALVAFEAPVAMAFTAGLVRPRIFVSTATLDLLAPDELEAVLLHERAHLQRADPLRIALARLIASALFFLPLADELRRRFEVAKELDADRAVLEAQRRVAPLAGALERLGTAAPLRSRHVAVGAWSCASARVGQLEGAPPATLLPSQSARAVWITVLVLAGLFALALSQAARANIVPAAAWDLSGAPVSASIHACPLPAEGPLL